MELTKEEMKKVIGWLENYYSLIYGSHDSPKDLHELPTVTHKFKTYLEGGETNDSETTKNDNQ